MGLMKFLLPFNCLMINDLSMHVDVASVPCSRYTLTGENQTKPSIIVMKIKILGPLMKDF